MLNVRSTLHYVGTSAGEVIALSLYRDLGGGGGGGEGEGGGSIAQFFFEEGWFARVTDLAIMYSYL